MAGTLVGMCAQVDQCGHGQLLGFAIQFEIHGKLRGNCPLQLSPGVTAAQAEFRGQGLLRFAHQELALVGGFFEHEGMFFGRGTVL